MEGSQPGSLDSKTDQSPKYDQLSTAAWKKRLDEFSRMTGTALTPTDTRVSKKDKSTKQQTAEQHAINQRINKVKSELIQKSKNCQSSHASGAVCEFDATIDAYQEESLKVYIWEAGRTEGWTKRYNWVGETLKRAHGHDHPYDAGSTTTIDNRSSARGEGHEQSEPYADSEEFGRRMVVAGMTTGTMLAKVVCAYECFQQPLIKPKLSQEELDASIAQQEVPGGWPKSPRADDEQSSGSCGNW